MWVVIYVYRLLQLNVISFVWNVRWVVRRLFNHLIISSVVCLLNDKTSHVFFYLFDWVVFKGSFSPSVWVLVCFITLLLFTALLEQYQHLHGFYPVWVLTCVITMLFTALLEKYEHLHGFLYDSSYLDANQYRLLFVWPYQLTCSVSSLT